MSDLVGKNLGKYRIVARLGEGGMAQVYKAYQPGLDRHVAIKIMQSHLAGQQSSLNRFEQEAVAVARLRHPNIVQVHDFDVDGDMRYMVMEFIEGPTLRAELLARLYKNQPFSLAEIVRIFSALSSAVDYAHALSIIHRDLKPENVMIAPGGQVVLTDFGIAQMVNVKGQTVANEIVGTPGYMAPEQAEGARGDKRSDIYSLGIIVYEMVAGRVPFEGDSPVSVIIKHIHEPPPPPTTINPKVSPAVEQVILKALRKNPEERYPTAMEMAQALSVAAGLAGEFRVGAAFITAVAAAPQIKEVVLTPDRRPLSTSAPLPFCPYRGLFAFREADAPFYFGREAFIVQLLEIVRRQPMVAVLGPSGSGKSSVVFAGLLPRLRQDEGVTGGSSPSMLHAKRSSFVIASFRPGSHPFQAMAAALLPLLQPKLSAANYPAEANKLSEALHQGRTRLSAVMARIRQPDQADSRVLLVIDQFEEIFTLCTDLVERRRFIDELLDVVEAERRSGTTPAFTLLLTMRADFLGQALAHRSLADALQEADVKLGPMTRQELDRAIENPAGRQGVLFETGLAARILDDVGEEPGKLPLLEFALTLLWERQIGGLLTHQAYEEIGRVEGALAHYADEVFTALNPAKQEQARHLFLQLVRPGQRTEDTRRIATRAEVGEANWMLAQGLASARLVVTGRNTAGQETVEVAHEALIRGWARLRDWLNADRAFRTWQERLRVALQQWEDSRRDEGALLHGALLAEAESWLAERSRDLSQAEHTFMQASLALRQRQQTARERQRQRLIFGLSAGLAVAAIGLVLMLGLAVFAFMSRSQARTAAQEAEIQRQAAETAAQEAEVQRQTAEAAAQEAETQRQAAETAAQETEKQRQIALTRQLAAQSLNYAASQPDLALLLSLEAGQIDQTLSLETQRSLLGTLETNPYLVTFLRGHLNDVNSVAFNRTGTILASASADKSIILWDVAKHQPFGSPLIGHTDWVNSVAFSPDGKLLASGSDDKTIILWNLKTQQPGRRLEGHTDWVRSVAFSSDGKMLASAGCGVMTESECTEGEIRLWDVETGRLLGQLRGHTAVVHHIAFSPAGPTLASASDDETIILWNTQTQQPLSQPLTGHTDWVNTLAFSPDGQTLASGSRDGTIILWDLTSQPYRRRGRALTGHINSVLGLAFSPDGQKLASSSWDKTIIIWNVASREPLGAPLTGHTEVVKSVAFSPDGQTLASASADNTVILWNLATRQSLAKRLAEQSGGVNSVAYSPDGQTLASASTDHTIILWDTLTGRPRGSPLTGHTDWVSNVVFSPDGKTLASGSGDATIILWDVATGAPLGSPLAGHSGGVWGLAFSPDSRLLASTGSDKAIILWDVAQGQQLGQLSGHTDSVTSLAFSPDGQILASGSWDKTVRLWNVETLQALSQPLTGHTSQVYALAFSPDGQTLASGGQDTTIILWDVRDRNNPAQLGSALTGHTDSVLGLAFSLDANQPILASSSWDKTIILWDVSARQPLGSPLTGHTEPVDGLAFNPNGQILASGSRDGTIRLWDVQTGQTRGEPWAGHRRSVRSVTFNPNGQTLAWGSEDNTITLWDIAGEKIIGQPLAAHTNWVNEVMFSPDGKLLASASGDKTIILWDVKQRQKVAQLTDHTAWVNSLAFSPDGKLLASASDDKTIILWDVKQRQKVAQLDHPNQVNSLTFSPDGKLLASGGDDDTVILWNVADRKAVGSPMTGPDAVESVAFSPDGKILAAGYDDTTIILWDVATGQQLGSPLTGHGGWVGSLAFNPKDGRILASAGGEKRIILWDITTRQPLGPPLAGHTADVLGLAFSPDGQTLVSGGADGAITRWEVSPASWQARACQVAARNLTWDEWQQYLPHLPYRATCPKVYLPLAELYQQADTYALAGQTEQAEEAFELAVKLAVETNSATLNNQVCWFGSLDRLPKVVFPACQRGVELAPEDSKGYYYDSRGLAHALLKEYKEAIADFEVFVKWSKETRQQESLRSKREQWLVDLKAGRDPFDDATLENLREE